MKSYEKKRREACQFHLTSDMSFSKVLEDREVCEGVINLAVPSEDTRLHELLQFIKYSEAGYQTNLFPKLAKKVDFYKRKTKGWILCVKY